MPQEYGPRHEFGEHEAHDYYYPGYHGAEPHHWDHQNQLSGMGGQMGVNDFKTRMYMDDSNVFGFGSSRRTTSAPPRMQTPSTGQHVGLHGGPAMGGDTKAESGHGIGNPHTSTPAAPSTPAPAAPATPAPAAPAKQPWRPSRPPQASPDFR